MEEPAGCLDIPLRRHEDVDHLTGLVDRALHIAPTAQHLDVGLVDPPAIADGMPAWAGGLDQQRREPPPPAVDGDVVDLDPALGDELLDIAKREAEAEIPADRQHDHVGCEAKPAKPDRATGAGRGRVTCQQCHRSDAVTRNATEPTRPARAVPLTPLLLPERRSRGNRVTNAVELQLRGAGGLLGPVAVPRVRDAVAANLRKLKELLER